jgi:hypothetical protein
LLKLETENVLTVAEFIWGALAVAADADGGSAPESVAGTFAWMAAN